MENLVKPRQLRASLVLMISAFLYQLIHFLIFDLPTTHRMFQVSNVAIYILITVFILFYGFLFYNIFKAKSWARILWTLLFLIFFIGALKSTNSYEQDTVILTYIGTVFRAVEIIAFVLLWNPVTTRWFKAMQAARLAVLEPTGTTTEKNAENDDENVLSPIDSASSSSETEKNKTISYNILLKILRAIRSLYVFSVITIFIVITAIYVVIVNDVAKRRNFPDIATSVGMDNAITNLLFIILLISLVYIIIENLVDRKLQSYPSNLVDKSYSNKTILLLSFFYTYFFFSLNNRIFIAFIYTNVENKPGITPLILLILIDIAIICFIFKYLIRKIDNKKIWKYFWIFAPLIFFIVGPTEMLIFTLGMRVFADPFLFIMKTLKSIFGVAG